MQEGREMTTARKLLDLIAEFAEARRSEADESTLQTIAQRFDVTLSEASW
jgi:hypothetical protein